MSDAPVAPSSGSMSFSLRVPVQPKFRAVASALVGKFAEVCGFGSYAVRGLSKSFDQAAEDVVALQGAGEGDCLDIRFDRGDHQMEIAVACGGHHAHVVRALPPHRA
jgi:hypothetical protein